jgi:hypothetical protein
MGGWKHPPFDRRDYHYPFSGLTTHPFGSMSDAKDRPTKWFFTSSKLEYSPSREPLNAIGSFGSVA